MTSTEPTYELIEGSNLLCALRGTRGFRFNRSRVIRARRLLFPSDSGQIVNIPDLPGDIGDNWTYLLGSSVIDIPRSPKRSPRSGRWR